MDVNFSSSPHQSSQYYQALKWRLVIIATLICWTIILIFNILIFSNDYLSSKVFQQQIFSVVDDHDFSYQIRFTTPFNRQNLHHFYLESSRPPVILTRGFNHYRGRMWQYLIIFDIIIMLSSSAVIYYLIDYILRPARRFAREQKDFIANASHELKTPLTTIKTELALWPNQKISDPELRESFDIINTEVNTMSNLTKNLLLLSTVEHQNNFFEEFNVADFLTQKVNRYQRQLSKKTLIVSLKIDPIAKNLKIFTSHQKLSQIIDILFDNAQKYATPNTKIQLVLSKKSDKIRIEVINQGVGIDPTEKEKIFQRFYRSCTPEISAQSGSGLGLAIAKRLASELDINLMLVDGSSQHTTFVLELKFIKSKNKNKES